MPVRPLPEGWTRRYVWAWKKNVPCLTFAEGELCVANDPFDDFMLFHRRSGWVLRSRVPYEEAVRLAQAWAGFDWDFEDELETAALVTRTLVVEWLRVDGACRTAEEGRGRDACPATGVPA